jgi:hypothetical protein
MESRIGTSALDFRYTQAMNVPMEIPKMETRSPASRMAHILERTGLALAGASCGLFVAVHVARSGIEVLASLGAIFAMTVWRHRVLSGDRYSGSRGSGGQSRSSRAFQRDRHVSRNDRCVRVGLYHRG